MHCAAGLFTQSHSHGVQKQFALWPAWFPISPWSSHSGDFVGGHFTGVVKEEERMLFISVPEDAPEGDSLYFRQRGKVAVDPNLRLL